MEQWAAERLRFLFDRGISDRRGHDIQRVDGTGSVTSWRLNYADWLLTQILESSEWDDEAAAALWDAQGLKAVLAYLGEVHDKFLRDSRDKPTRTNIQNIILVGAGLRAAADVFHFDRDK